MAQTQTIPAPVETARIVPSIAPSRAPLIWDVVETAPGGRPWAIAGFNVRQDAEAFVEAKTGSGRALEIVENAEWSALRGVRPLRRPADVTAQLAEMDA